MQIIVWFFEFRILTSVKAHMCHNNTIAHEKQKHTVCLFRAMALKTKSVNPAKMKFNGKKSTADDGFIPAAQDTVSKNKHIIFDGGDDDEIAVTAPPVEKKQVSKKSEKSRKEASEIGKQWYQKVQF